MSKNLLENWEGLTPIDLKGNFIPFEIFDNLIPRINNMSELKVVLFIVRRTLTFNKTEDWIAKTQFENGMYNKKTGEEINKGCGLSRPSIDEGIRRAVEHGIIEERICCSSCGTNLNRIPETRPFRWVDKDGEQQEKVVRHNRVPNNCPSCVIATQGKMQYFYQLVFKQEDH